MSVDVQYSGYCGGAGTFAVVSLMVGTAVSDANCDVVSYSSSSSASSSDDWNSTVSYNSSVTESVNSGGSAVSSSDDDAENQCRIGVAVALTFLVGIFQVIALLQELTG